MTYSFDFESGSSSVTRPDQLFLQLVEDQKSTAFVTEAKETLLSEVEEFWRECTAGSSENFDIPVSLDTFLTAKKFLMTLPLGMDPGEVLPISRDGYLSFEWNGPHDKSFSVVVAQNRLFFAALLNNGNRFKGSVDFNEQVPEQILMAIKDTLK